MGTDAQRAMCVLTSLWSLEQNVTGMLPRSFMLMTLR